MTHLLILCEGHTEKGILETFLHPYWKIRFDTVEIQRYDGNQDLRINFKGDTEQQLTQEPHSNVLCLVDLYEEPFGLYKPGKMTAAQGYEVVREYMYRQVNSRFHSKFGAFPVVVEIETWLLADPNIQQELNVNFPQPELVEHAYGTLEKIYKTKNKLYGKISDGINLFRKASAERVYADSCPHFNELADWLINSPQILGQVSETITKAQQEWENQRDEKYNYSLRLEKDMTSDADLEQALKAEQDYQNFLLTYPDIFK